MIPSNKITVKGVFIIQTLNLLAKKFPANKVQTIKKELGNVDFRPFQDYPIDYQVRLESIACKNLYPGKGEDGFIEFGKMSFHSFTESFVGKILFTLVGTDVKKLILSTPRFWNAMTKGLEIKTAELADNKVSVRFLNNPYTPSGIKGVFLEGLIFFGIPGEVNVKVWGSHDHEFIIQWPIDFRLVPIKKTK